ncbi:zinc finger C2H2-type/integrase DNA-binding domain-containing protein [Tanacetum coccineum]
MDKVTENCEKEDSLMMIGSSTPMLIKLKISKTNKEEGKRVCSVCKKEISSGKALGGHMRVHVIVNDEGVPTCSQCGKSFPSMKSLFGHMRCHPDRFWRGIIPPPNAVLAQGNPQVVGGKSSFLSCNNSNVVDNGDGSGGGHVVDLTKYLKGWSVTERRGRRSLKMDDSDEDLLEAVEDLMSLANGHRSSVIQGSNSNANSPP